MTFNTVLFKWIRSIIHKYKNSNWESIKWEEQIEAPQRIKSPVLETTDLDHFIVF